MSKKDDAIKLLKDIRHMAHLIDIADEEIAKLYTALTSTTVKPKEVDVQTSGAQDPMGDRIIEIIEYENKIREYQKDLIVKKDNALVVISQMDAEEQEVLMLRYFKGLSIEKTAEELGLSYFGCWKKINNIEEHFCEIYSKTFD